MDIGRRIKRRRDELGLSQPALGKRLSVTRNTISQWENNWNLPKTERLGQIEDALSMDRGALTGRGEGVSNVVASAPGLYSVPLVSYVRAASWSEAVDAYEEGGGDTMLYTSRPVSGSAFALTVQGTSMEPRFYDGDEIIVDPSEPAQPGDFVVAKLDGTDEATFKKYRPRRQDARGDQEFDLVPLNEDWPTLRVNADQPGHVVGPVVEHRHRLRR